MYAWVMVPLAILFAASFTTRRMWMVSAESFTSSPCWR